MNMHGFSQEEAERILEVQRARQAERERTKAQREAESQRLEHYKRHLASKDAWQAVVFPLAAKVAAEGYDISRLAFEDALWDMCAEWLIEDQDDYEAAREDEYPDANEWYDRQREERYVLNSYDEVRRMA